MLTLRGGIHAPSGEPRGVANVRGGPINHPGPGYGDGYHYTWMADWNDDGRADLLWGTQQGNIYLHLKDDGHDPTSFEEGELLTLSTGEPLRVGPPVVESPAEAKDHPCCRDPEYLWRQKILTATVCWTSWFPRPTVTSGSFVDKKSTVTERWHRESLLAKLPRRTESLVFDDWDHDDQPDLLLGGPPDHPIQILFNRSIPDQPALEAPQNLPGLPYVFW